MAINLSVYSNGNSSSRVVTFDFYGDVVAGANEIYAANASSYIYYIKGTTTARQDDGTTGGPTYPVKIMTSLSSLALKGAKQSKSNTASSYSDIKSLIIDYTYDFIYGHTEDQFSSGVTEQKPMRF